MNHLSEEQLILHYYGEEGSEALTAEQHLDECEDCRGVYTSLQRVLNVVDSLPVPERGPEYGAQVWKRIAHAAPRRPSPTPFAAGLRLAMGRGRSGIRQSCWLSAFMAGRMYQHPHTTGKGGAERRRSAGRPAHPLVAVGDYLERSQLVLVELANASSKDPWTFRRSRNAPATW